MKLRLPSLRTLVQDASRSGAVANRFQVSREEAERIRKAERQGGHQAGLVVVLQLLREKNQDRSATDSVVSYRSLSAN
jgi:hypothetical protein